MPHKQNAPFVGLDRIIAATASSPEAIAEISREAWSTCTPTVMRSGRRVAARGINDEARQSGLLSRRDEAPS